MLYSLIIADDEHMMRQGLSNMINWEQLGFRVDGVFSNGSEVIDYLANHIPDVLLLDITMPLVSGLDTAAFVAKNNISTKIILLSGYRDFEYAQKAVEYNVAHYLLKPISIPHIKKLFQEMRITLDTQASKEEALQYRNDRYNQMLSYQRKQFFLELLLGLLTPEALPARLVAAEIKAADENRGFLSLSLRIAHNATWETLQNEFGTQEMQEQILHLLESFDYRLEYYSLITQEEKLSSMGLYWEKEPQTVLVGYTAEEAEQKIGQLIFLMTGLTVETCEIRLFPSVSSLLTAEHNLPAEGQGYSEFEEELLRLVSEKKKIVLTYLQEGSAKRAKEVYASLLEQATPLGMSNTHAHMTHLFSVAIEQVSGTDNQTASALLGKINLSEIYSLQTTEALLVWGEKNLQILVDTKQEQSKNQNQDCIDIIRRYIDLHYSQDITLGAMAEMVYLNPIYVSRLFKERCGKTFTEYLAQVRIKAAMHLLAHSNHFVYEIGSMVGYRDIKYFYKIFRRFGGCSPSEYREQIAQKEENNEVFP